jgi:S-adenosyl-L-methionine hydrolase (adenosine-forming)
MPLITLTSDLGSKDNYVALVKAEIYKNKPAPDVIDISHDIEKFNIMQAAYIFGNAYRFFPDNTFHLVGIRSHTENKRILYVEAHRQKIICIDNGFLTLLPETYDARIFSLHENEFPVGLFFLRDTMVKAALQLSEPGNVEKLAKPCSDYLQSMLFQPTATSDSIVGRCIHIDSFGNVVTNITRHFFDLVRKNRKFRIILPGTQLNKIVADYNDVPETNALALFNSFGYLEIAINRDKASQMLFSKGHIDFNITVQFEE